ncbi:MAG TPA: hypothetical protein VMV26_04125 [Alphaproteobacteria bacterium]|nr:hypothetical protein [Alphaproteobacteria bacterium]
MTRPRGSLERHIAEAPASDDEIAAMARAAWLKRGWLCVRPQDLVDPFERQLAINIAERRYGKRAEAKR